MTLEQLTCFIPSLRLGEENMQRSRSEKYQYIRATDWSWAQRFVYVRIRSGDAEGLIFNFKRNKLSELHRVKRYKMLMSLRNSTVYIQD